MIREEILVLERENVLYSILATNDLAVKTAIEQHWADGLTPEYMEVWRVLGIIVHNHNVEAIPGVIAQTEVKMPCTMLRIKMQDGVLIEYTLSQQVLAGKGTDTLLADIQAQVDQYHALIDANNATIKAG